MSGSYRLRAQDPWPSSKLSCPGKAGDKTVLLWDLKGFFCGWLIKVIQEAVEVRREGETGDVNGKRLDAEDILKTG